jgi:putative redox protein
MTDTGTPLATASALLPATEERLTGVHVGRHHLSADAAMHLHQAAVGPTPIGLLAAALASDTVMTLRAYTDVKYAYPGDLEAVVTIVDGSPPAVRRLVTFTEDLDADQVAHLDRIAASSPITRIFEPACEVTTIIRRSTAATR